MGLNVTLVIGSLGGGGAERALVNLAAGLTAQGHSVTIVTIWDRRWDFYAVPPRVKRRSLDLPLYTVPPPKTKVIRDNLTQLRLLRGMILSTSPQVVIAFLEMTNVTTLLALIGTSAPIIVVEQTDPTSPHIRPIWKGLRRLLYPRAALVVSASNGIDSYFRWLPAQRRAIIPNILIIEKERQAGTLRIFKGRGRYKVISMGRLVPYKGFDQLLDAFAQISAQQPDWDLYILGEGEQRPELEARLADLNLAGRAFLPGRVRNPRPVLQAADLFVLPSRVEGFGNVIVEALAAGLPVISFDCCCGPRDIIRDGVDGILVPAGNITLLADAMARLMSDTRERKRLAARAPEAVARFGVENVIKQWELALDRVVSKITL